jgi:hypothetical protein
MPRDLIRRALMIAINLLQPKAGIVFPNNGGSQYTGPLYQNLLASFWYPTPNGDVGACWDDAVVKRVLGRLKHDWILKLAYHIRKHMKLDAAQYIRFCNNDRLHSHWEQVGGQLDAVPIESVRYRLTRERNYGATGTDTADTAVILLIWSTRAGLDVKSMSRDRVLIAKREKVLRAIVSTKKVCLQSTTNFSVAWGECSMRLKIITVI